MAEPAAAEPAAEGWRRLPKQPRILVTNDDGINAPGLRILERVRAQRQRRRLGGRARDQSERRVALLDDQPAAAHPPGVEAALRGRRHADRLRAAGAADRDEGRSRPSWSSPASITAAISARTSPTPAPWRRPWRRPCSTCRRSPSARSARTVSGSSGRPRRSMRRRSSTACLREGWPQDALINVNFPDRIGQAVDGWRVTFQGKRKLGDELVERIDPRGQPYVWIGGLRCDEDLQRGSDLEAVARRLHLGDADSHGHDASLGHGTAAPRPCLRFVR